MRDNLRLSAESAGKKTDNQPHKGNKNEMIRSETDNGKVMKQQERDKATLPVMELFYSIQGEGYNTGTPAFFIRLAGCDVGCSWCDVTESWDAEKHNAIQTDEILLEVINSGAKTVVITGGEPLMYDLDEICRKIKNKGIQIFLETSGAYPLSGTYDWICVSPKKMKEPLPELLSSAQELKIIVYNKSDFEWAEQNALKVRTACVLYLQPEWGRAEENTAMIIDYIKRNPKWKISLQTHKYMGIR